MVKELTPVQKVHHKVELLGGLEGKVELDDEGVRDFFEDLSLG
jgi:hypothetical protein